MGLFIMQQHPQAVSQMYDFLLYAIPQMAKLPKNHRYLLGERIETTSLSVLELLVAANYKKEKLQELMLANIEIQKLRFLIRLSKDLKLLSIQKYETMSKMLVDIGKQTGGWRKSLSP